MSKSLMLLWLVVSALLIETMVATASSENILLPSIRNAASIMTFMMPNFVQMPIKTGTRYPYKLFLYREQGEELASSNKVRLNGFPLLYIPQGRKGSFKDARSLGVTLYEMMSKEGIIYRRETYTEGSYVEQMITNLSEENFGSNETKASSEREDQPLIGFDVYSIDFNNGEWSDFHKGLHKRQEEYIRLVIEYLLKDVYKKFGHRSLIVVSQSGEHNFESISRGSDRDLIYTVFAIQANQDRIEWSSGDCTLTGLKNQITDLIREWTMNGKTPNNQQRESTRMIDFVNIIGTSFMPNIYSNMDKNTMKWSKQFQQVLSGILLNIANSAANSQPGRLDMSSNDRSNIISRYMSLKTNSLEEYLISDENAAKRENVKMATLKDSETNPVPQIFMDSVTKVEFKKSKQTKYYLVDSGDIQTQTSQFYIFTNFLRREVDVFLTEDRQVGGQSNGPKVISKTITKLSRQHITTLPYLNVNEENLEEFQTNTNIAKVMIKIPKLDTTSSTKKIYVRVRNLYTAEEMSMEGIETYPDRFIAVSSHPGTFIKEDTNNKPFVIDAKYQEPSFWVSGQRVDSNKAYVVIPNLMLSYSYKLTIYNNECSKVNIFPVLQYHYGDMFEYESVYMPLRYCGDNVINLQFENLTSVSNSNDERLYGVALYLLNTKNVTSFKFKIEVDYVETFINTIIHQQYHTVVTNVFSILLLVIGVYKITYSLAMAIQTVWFFAPLIVYLQFKFSNQVFYISDFSILHLSAAYIYAFFAVLLLIAIVRSILFILGIITRFLSLALLTQLLGIALFIVGFFVEPAVSFSIFTLFVLLYMSSEFGRTKNTMILLSTILYVLVTGILLFPSSFAYLKEWLYWVEEAKIDIKDLNDLKIIWNMRPDVSLTSVCSPFLLIPFYVLKPYSHRPFGIFIVVLAIMCGVFTRFHSFLILPCVALCALLL